MGDAHLQVDAPALAKKLDEINDKFKDTAAFQESQGKEVADIKADLEQYGKQLQEVAADAKRIASQPRSLNEKHRMIAETVIKAQSEGTDASGGYAVADEFATTVRETQNNYGAVRQIWGSNIIPMATDVLKVPTGAAEETAGNEPEAAAISENAQITADDGKIGQVSLTANKYGSLIYVSSELIADAFIDYIGGYLTRQIARQTAKKEDDLVFNDSTDGLLNDANFKETVMASGSVDFADATIENLRALVDQVTDDALEMGAFYAHRSVRTQIANTRVGGSTTTDGPFAWGNPNIGIPPTLDGYEFVHVGKMPANSASAVSTEFILFGDLPAAQLVGERVSGNGIALSNDFRFDYDQTAVRYLFRLAFGNDANTGRAAARLKTAAS